ncbi:MAG: hypothetical protein AAF564_07395 [Bacteroidota bacterium]
MTFLQARCKAALFSLLLLCTVGAAGAQDLDAYWAEVSRTVNEGDFEGYAALYHEDAVLVSDFSQSSVPIATALTNWKPGFDDTKAGKMTASVVFRFATEYVGEDTAFSRGIFRYASAREGEAENAQYINFEALLVKKDVWLMVMESQLSTATEADWDALTE